ncbi:hypothetical protein [Halodesulfovibrio sp.]|jgi:hypothetical protein|uniref:hypothetical protein n=1 Tax=Halodesulfovibrio sp. TaxID=1912772 RepID=UPI0025F6F834|nr:hypothetical protein [Halodesulfovibrio sp.]MCT4627945.1 hypothetical protein [Halodesulfovibrio sp.]
MLSLEKFELEALCRLQGASDGNVLCDVIRREITSCKDDLVRAGDEMEIRILQGKAQAYLELLEALETPHERIQTVKRQEAQIHGETPY